VDGDEDGGGEAGWVSVRKDNDGRDTRGVKAGIGWKGKGGDEGESNGRI